MMYRPEDMGGQNMNVEWWQCLECERYGVAKDEFPQGSELCYECIEREEHGAGRHDGEDAKPSECPVCRAEMKASMKDALTSRPAPEPAQCPPGECDFDADEGYHCLNCGKDGSEDVMARAEALADFREER